MHNSLDASHCDDCLLKVDLDPVLQVLERAATELARTLKHGSAATIAELYSSDR